jgi:putative SOS response-associated peptidase YedK
MADDNPMLMAGLWEEWGPPGEERVRSCTIITTEPNEAMGGLQDRMPVILGEADWPLWLGEEPATEAELKALLRPCPSEWIRMWPVGRAVGNVRNDRPDLAEPLQTEAQPALL